MPAAADVRRLHLIEIHEQAWCPAGLRDAATAYLEFAVRIGRPYASTARLLRQALEASDARRVLDLCSGAGGPWPSLYASLCRAGEERPSIQLSDRHPNRGLVEQVEVLESDELVYLPEPVDATAVPPELHGFRTLFSAFHHFRLPEARGILRDAVAAGEGIAIFETTRRTFANMLAMLVVPPIVLLSLPFLRPFCWKHMLWSFPLPLLPFVVLFDGIVSCLRSYTQAELTQLVESLGATSYHWQIGRTGPRFSPRAVDYLIGYPPPA